VSLLLALEIKLGCFLIADGRAFEGAPPPAAAAANEEVVDDDVPCDEPCHGLVVFLLLYRARKMCSKCVP